MTDYFTALNRVKQGAVLSPILYSVYVDDLMLILSKADVSCFISLHFVGALAYADDLVLLAPTTSAMRKLLAICEDYAREYSISFDALKSKYLVALPKNCRNTFKKVNDYIFFIDGRMIDHIQPFSHLGHLITSDSDDGEDITMRKHSFVGQVNNLLSNYPLLLNIINFMHIVLVIMNVSYGCYQIVTLTLICCLAKELETHVGSSVSDTQCSITTLVSMPSRLTRNMSVFS